MASTTHPLWVSIIGGGVALVSGAVAVVLDRRRLR
jgi:hypothetical protein